MKNRIVPQPELFASCPSDRIVLDYYNGQFDSVYVILHPFLRSIKLDLEMFCPEKWPSKQQIINGCEAISWKKIIEMTGLNSISEIDIGLRTSIGGLISELENKKYSDVLSLLENEIIHPSEGEIPPIIEDNILNSIKHLDDKWLWVGDEFGTERKLHAIDDLISEKGIPCHGCIFTHDHNLLVTSHWDSHCSFLCSSRENIENNVIFS